MNFIPYEKFEYQTSLDVPEVQKRLEGVVQLNKSEGIPGNFGNSQPKFFQGNIDQNTFNLRPKIKYNNSFLPNIKGNIEQDLRGSKLKFTMSLSPFIYIFMGVWMTAVGFACVYAANKLANEANFEPALLIPFFMLIMGYVTMTFGFNYEAKKVKKYLANLLEINNKKER